MTNIHDLSVPGEVTIAVRDFGGSGAEILLLHGAGCNLEDLTPIAEDLVRDHRVVAMDLRSHGQSEDGPWDVDAVLDDIGRVIAFFRFAAPTLAGHSLGGMLSALYAVRRGGVAAVVNWDGYGFGRPELYDGMEPDEVAAFRARADALDEDIPPAGHTLSSDDLLRYLTEVVGLADQLRFSARIAVAHGLRHLVEGGDRTVRLALSRERNAEMMHALTDIDWLATFAQVEVPFLLYRCESNERMPAELRPAMESYGRGLRAAVTEMERAHRNLAVRILPGEHHFFVTTMPHALAEDVRRLLVGVVPK